MDYKAVSQQVVDNVGGLENIEGATHCVTRLRLVLKDTSKYNKAELENIDGVKGVLYNSGQLMISSVPVPSTRFTMSLWL